MYPTHRSNRWPFESSYLSNIRSCSSRHSTHLKFISDSLSLSVLHNDPCSSQESSKDLSFKRVHPRTVAKVHAHSTQTLRFYHIPLWRIHGEKKDCKFSFSGLQMLTDTLLSHLSSMGQGIGASFSFSSSHFTSDGQQTIKADKQTDGLVQKQVLTKNSASGTLVRPGIARLTHDSGRGYEWIMPIPATGRRFKSSEHSIYSIGSLKLRQINRGE